jgi:hypothetical protein
LREQQLSTSARFPIHWFIRLRPVDMSRDEAKLPDIVFAQGSKRGAATPS